VAVRWLFWVAWEWTLIAAALAVAWHWPVLIPLAVLVVGSRQHALLVLGHEASHKSIGNVDALAQLLCFWPHGACIKAYRREHLKHHREIGLPHDPEVIIRAQTPSAWSGLTPGKKMRLLLGDLVGLGIRESIIETRAAVGEHGLARILYVGVILAAAIASGLWPLLLLWVWCLLTSLRAMDRARTWREHFDLPPGRTHRYIAMW